MPKIELHIHFATPLQIHLHAAAPSGLEQIQQTLVTIMSQIAEFSAKVSTHLDQIDTAVAGLSDDNKALTELIAKLQASADTLSAEDQATLDAIEARTAKQADALSALDALTPPVAPPVPGTGPAPFVPEGVTAAPKAPPFVPAAVPPEAPTA